MLKICTINNKNPNNHSHKFVEKHLSFHVKWLRWLSREQAKNEKWAPSNLLVGTKALPKPFFTQIDFSSIHGFSVFCLNFIELIFPIARKKGELLYTFYCREQQVGTEINNRGGRVFHAQSADPYGELLKTFVSSWGRKKSQSWFTINYHFVHSKSFILNNRTERAFLYFIHFVCLGSTCKEKQQGAATQAQQRKIN